MPGALAGGNTAHFRIGWVSITTSHAVAPSDAILARVRKLAAATERATATITHSPCASDTHQNRKGPEDRRHEAAFTLCHPFEFT